MENICYQCHAQVPQGKVFCPECRAPLIRVAVPEAPLYPPPVLAAEPQLVLPSQTPIKAISPGKVEWIHGLPAATLAGAIAAVLMIVSRGGFGVGMFATGSLALIFYRRRNPDANITVWMGTKLGLMSGLIGFGISAVFVAVVTLFSGPERLRSFLLELAKLTPVYRPNPEIQQRFEYLMTPQGFPELVLLYFFSFLLIFLIFSAIGGTLGAVWMRLRRRP